MKVATIVPACLLDFNQDDDFHMSLAQNIGIEGNKASEKYTHFFQQQRAAGKFVLMDNGAAEGAQPTAEELLPKIELLRPSELILPDTICNKDDTLRKGLTACEFFFKHNVYEITPRCMGVPQGETIEKWKECVLEMLKWGVDTIGVSKFITKRFAGIGMPASAVRYEAVHFIREHSKTVAIHLLGCWADPREVGCIATQPNMNVRSVDSAIAYVYTRDFAVLEPALTARPAGEIDFLGATSKGIKPDLLKQNKQIWRDMCNGIL